MDVDWPEEPAPKILRDTNQDWKGHDLRQRQPTNYLAPWQKQSKKSTNVIKIEEDETEDRLATIPVAKSKSPSSDRDGISMLLQAAVLVERRDIPCIAVGCPIKGPHSEGLFIHPEAVPNSTMANTFFAPSIPPPSVVQAFNNINGRPSWHDLDTKDHFFEYHTAPCRPSKHLSKVAKTSCTSNNCGVVGQPHKKGIFLQDGLDASINLSRRVKFIFGISNPPAEVWEAAIRYVDGVSNHVDDKLVDDFRAHHVRLEDGAPDKKEFYRWQQHGRAQRP